jgi:hypothetical protein
MSGTIVTVAAATASKAVRVTAIFRRGSWAYALVTISALVLSFVLAHPARASSMRAGHATSGGLRHLPDSKMTTYTSASALPKTSAPPKVPARPLGAPRTVTIIDGAGPGDRALSPARIRRLEPGVLADANSYLTSWWGVGTVRFVNVGDWTSVRAHQRGWRMFLTRRALGTGKLGYHAVDRYGPYAVVSVSTADRYRTPVSLVVSHELNEMMVDPQANGTSSDGFALEVVDPVADIYSMLDGVAVADFVTPNWLAWNSDGPWDAAGVLPSDHSTAPGGYTLTTFLQTRGWSPAHLRHPAGVCSESRATRRRGSGRSLPRSCGLRSRVDGSPRHLAPTATRLAARVEW